MKTVANRSMVSATSVVREEQESRELVGLNAGVLALVRVSTFAVIHSTHTCRALYAQMQVLESSQWYLQEEYGRLLLEHSTWASHHRVEKVARGSLGMQAPDLELLEVVQQ